jgi:formate dehydrogenase iron-sulfur subunit
MKTTDDRNRVAVLVDTTRCMGCRGCQVACKQWNQLKAVETEFTGSYENPKHLSGDTWTIVRFIESNNGGPKWRFRKQQCLHCEDASCVTVCPTGAANKTGKGLVVIDQSICTGCKYCVEACPFQTPQYKEESGTAIKCRFCWDRLAGGLGPACVKACPSGALSFGARDEILAEAKRRQRAKPGSQIWGETQLGGLGWIYLLDRSPEEMGLPVDPKAATKGIFGKWFAGVLPGVAILGGLAWLFKRRSSRGAQAAGKASPEKKA